MYSDYVNKQVDEISKLVINAANEIMLHWNNILLENGKTLYQDLSDKANSNESIYPREVFVNEDLEKLAMKHMGVYYNIHGWAVASAVFNVAGGYPIKGK